MTAEPIDFGERLRRPRVVELRCGRAQLIELVRDCLIIPPAIALPRGMQLFVVVVQGGHGGHRLTFEGFRDAPVLAPGPAGTRGSWLFCSDDVSLQYIGGAVRFE
jgi:hypothetical protein